MIMKNLKDKLVNEVRTDIRTPWTKEQALEYINDFLKGTSYSVEEGKKIHKLIESEDWKKARKWFMQLANENRSKDLKEFYKSLYTLIFDAIENN